MSRRTYTHNNEANFREVNLSDVIHIWLNDKYSDGLTNHAVVDRIDRLIDEKGNFFDLGKPVLCFISDHINEENKHKGNYEERLSIITDTGCRFIYDLETEKIITQYWINGHKLSDIYERLNKEMPDVLKQNIKNNAYDGRIFDEYTDTEAKIKAIENAKVNWMDANEKTHTGKFISELFEIYQEHEDFDVKEKLRFIPLDDKNERFLDLSCSDIGAYVIIDDSIESNDKENEELKEKLCLSEYSGKVEIKHLTYDVFKDAYSTRREQDAFLEKYRNKALRVKEDASHPKKLNEALLEAPEHGYVGDVLMDYYNEHNPKSNERTHSR